MFDMRYENARTSLKSGIFEDFSGRYSTIGRLIIPNAINSVSQAKLITCLDKEHMYSYEFVGLEPMNALSNIEQIIKNNLQNKKCVLFTGAPKENWWQNGDNSWKAFDKIIINRLSINDDENSELLGLHSLSNSDLNHLPTGLKSRIIFRVDCKKSKIKSEKSFVDYIVWARSLGIKRLIFCEDDSFKKKYLRKVKKERMANIRIKKNSVFPFKPLPDKLVLDTVENKITPKPLSIVGAQLLIKAGFHFKIAKAISTNGKLTKIITLWRKDIQISFESEVEENQLLAWETSRSRRYRVNLN